VTSDNNTAAGLVLNTQAGNLSRELPIGFTTGICDGGKSTPGTGKAGHTHKEGKIN